MTTRFPLGLSAHIGYLFADLPLAQRFSAAKAAGFDAVEHPNPLSIPPRTMLGLLAEDDLWFTQLAAATGDAARGEKGLAAVPGREVDFLESFKRAVDYAEAIFCPFVHPMAGIAPINARADAVTDTYFRNIDAALRVLERRPVRLLVEAISHSAVPGYYLHSLSQAIALSRSYAAGEVSILLDTFHARANGEDAVAIVSADVARIGHVHIADHPGRHEPGTGQFDFSAFVAQLKASGFNGALGFEYVPHTNTLDGLHWLPEWQAHADRDPSRSKSASNH